MTPSKRYRSVLLAVAVALAPLDAAQSPDRIVAIGDIHGSYDGLTTILKRTGLVNDQLKWAGGRTVLVQTGDYTDRGTDVRKVMDLLMQIEKDAKAAGGQAIVLAGNHEIMNVMGDLRDVTPEICATFTTDKSEARREEAWTQYERVARSRATVATPAKPATPATPETPGTPAPTVYSQTREAFMAAHPPGCLEYFEAMSPSGLYGRWIRSKDIATVVGGTLFMHAGLNPSRPAPASIIEVNDRTRAEVRQLDSLRKRLADRKLGVGFFGLQEVLDVSILELRTASQALAAAKAGGPAPPDLDIPTLREAQGVLDIAKWSLIDPEGPLWFRGYANWDETATSAQVTAFLDQMKLTRVVVGHTPTTDRRIVARYGGRVVVIDTGMLASAYMGNPSALEIVGPKMKAIYPDGEVELTLPKAARMSVPGATPSRTSASNPVTLAIAKLMPFRFRSGGMPGIGRG